MPTTDRHETRTLRSVGKGDAIAHNPSSTIFVSDPSAEAERLSQALRAMGYVVVDVPLSMLLARVSVQRPRLILVDADADGALESVERLRNLPDAEDIEVVFLGRAGCALAGPDDALAHEGSAFFDRPVDIPELIRQVEALAGEPVHDLSSARNHSTPPPSLPSSRTAAQATGGRDALGASSIGAPLRPAGTDEPASSEPPLSLAQRASRRAVSIRTPLSSELEALLAEAEERVGAQLALETNLPTPEEELDAVLPPEILSSLDAPLEGENELEGKFIEDAHGRVETGPYPAAHAGADAAAAETQGGGHSSPTTGNRAPNTSEAGPHPRDRFGTNPGRSGAVSPKPQDGSQRPPPTEHQRGMGPDASSTLGSVALLADAAAIDAAVAKGAAAARAGGMGTSLKAESVPPPNAPVRLPPIVLGETDAPLALARAIALRATGAFCVDSEEGVRRAVLREGDLLTAASGVDAESLLAFLGGRGDLPRERVEQLTGKVPPFGRHAGAALVAHGHLRQDQLWPVLRAHAEWILGKAILVRGGTAQIEAEPPGRLRSEPSVFGGSTGAEVMVEVVRRVIAPEDAIARLGGRAGRVCEGSHAGLLSECALDAAERDLLERMRGATLGATLQAASNPDFASVLYAISLLGVVEIVRSVDGARGASASDEAEIDALDEDAIRARVHARLEIVDEGNYFAVLGIAPDATGYEIRRAFLDLRRAFEPSRVLTPRIADLAEDVRKIASVLDEAYEILSDGARRERYRRAIFAAPESS